MRPLPVGTPRTADQRATRFFPYADSLVEIEKMSAASRPYHTGDDVHQADDSELPRVGDRALVEIWLRIIVRLCRTGELTNARN
jgi:hypothetical protein